MNNRLFSHNQTYTLMLVRQGSPANQLQIRQYMERLPTFVSKANSLSRDWTTDGECYHYEHGYVFRLRQHQDLDFQ